MSLPGSSPEPKRESQARPLREVVSTVGVLVAALLVALGLIKKVVIADYLARTVVDPTLAVPQLYSGPDAALAAYAYTAQI